jgi:hypothetical protein
LLLEESIGWCPFMIEMIDVQMAAFDVAVMGDGWASVWVMWCVMEMFLTISYLSNITIN